MSKRKLYVYIVHESMDFLAHYRILGVYIDKDLAEKHRGVARTKQKYFGRDISVTKHAVRGVRNLVITPNA